MKTRVKVYGGLLLGSAWLGLLGYAGETESFPALWVWAVLTVTGVILLIESFIREDERRR